MQLPQQPCSALIQCASERADGATYYDIIVSGGGKTWAAQRRYNEFLNLHTSMEMQGFYLPPMPPKSTFRLAFSSSFRETRQRCLQAILDAALSADPALNCRTLRSFLVPMQAMQDPAAVAAMQLAPFPGSVPASVQVQPAIAQAQPVTAQAQPVTVQAQPVATQAQPVNVQAQQGQPCAIQAQLMAGLQVTAQAQSVAAQVPPAIAPAQPVATSAQAVGTPVQPAKPQPVVVAQALPAVAQALQAVAQAQPAFAFAQGHPAHAQLGQAFPACGPAPVHQPMHPCCRTGPVCTQPAPMHAQPAAAFAQPAAACAQPAWAHPYHGGAQPACAQQASHGTVGGLSATSAALGAGAAGLIGGMMLESALESHHHRPHGGGFFGADRIMEIDRPHGFFGFGSEQVIENVHTGMFGDTQITREVVDRDMFGNVEGVREEFVDRDMFGNVSDAIGDW
mmetsp:Transcript_56685/g.160926  ORF Transcript_56685/g.160926 Transcript_56685/m.160926 type:complete len:451 (+) Transcript_56685:80-1432(+)